jgi:iron complex outermembrane recepter protein
MLRFWSYIISRTVIHLVRVVTVMVCWVLTAGENGNPPTLEELAATPITSVSRKAKPLRDSAAAVHVLTQEDIRRSGARNIPEALRMVPGLHVARITSNQWAISARGFNGRFANKMLVLMDGRSLYSTIFSGVFWDMVDTPLEDIERIEVIRGPGATMWGANAVNGVISIITKKSRDTQGTSVTAFAGTGGQHSIQGRQGGTIGRKGHYRVFGRKQRYESLHGDNDRWATSRGGFRTDWFLGRTSTFELQGDIFETHGNATLIGPALIAPFQQRVPGRVLSSGAAISGRWEGEQSSTSGSSVSFSFDRMDRNEPLIVSKIHQFNVDTQKRLTRGFVEFTFGGTYRATQQENNNSAVVRYDAPQMSQDLISGFVQSQLGTDEGPAELVFGIKVENNDFTGTEIQPRLQAVLRPSQNSSAWLSIGRAVRTPATFEIGSRMDFRAVQIPSAPLPILFELTGSRRMAAEALVAYETGYRYQPTPTLAFDVAVFRNQYDSLRTLEPTTPVLQHRQGIPYLASSLLVDNLMTGSSTGLELLTQYEVSSKWRLAGSTSWLRVALAPDPRSRDSISGRSQQRSPQQLMTLRSYYDLGRSLELDAILSYVSAVRDFSIPAYTRADIRLGWHVSPQWELSVTGENLLGSRHLEYEPEGFGRGNHIGRSVGSKLTWRF